MANGNIFPTTFKLVLVIVVTFAIYVKYKTWDIDHQIRILKKETSKLTIELQTHKEKKEILDGIWVRKEKLFELEQKVEDRKRKLKQRKREVNKLADQVLQ